MASNAEMVDYIWPISTNYVFGGSRYSPYNTDCSGMMCAAMWHVHGVDPYTFGDCTGAQWNGGLLRKLRKLPRHPIIRKCRIRKNLLQRRKKVLRQMNPRARKRINCLEFLLDTENFYAIISLYVWPSILKNPISQAEGTEGRVERMSSVILKENETLDSACAASREAVQRLVSSRKFVRESITKSLA